MALSTKPTPTTTHLHPSTPPLRQPPTPFNTTIPATTYTLQHHHSGNRHWNHPQHFDRNSSTHEILLQL
ncbi:hypothetical protein Hanom_Chr17g01550731 [Helianthus anomalus]